ncbi:MAG: hypothetical protein QUS33_00305 [Dehalococcoidia bacterium]|nr:hypothetical protein [Dehalococcoidia bacterium]
MNALLGIDRIAEATPWLVETSPWREDPLAIEETVRGFFEAFNSMQYDRCLSYVAMNMGGERERLVGLLRLARYFSGTVEVQRVANITIADSQASATVNAMVRSEATKEEVKLVKTGTGWKLLWDGAPTHKVISKLDGNGKTDGKSGRKARK